MLLATVASWHWTAALPAAQAAYSGNNGRIAFTSTRLHPNGDVFVMDADGEAQTALTNLVTSDGRPDWSPDGLQIVFDSNRNDNNGDMFVMNADGTGQTNTTPGSPSFEFGADWQSLPMQLIATIPNPGTGNLRSLVAHPDGSRLYVSDEYIVYEISTANHAVLRTYTPALTSGMTILDTDVLPDGSRLYVVSGASATVGRVTVIDISSFMAITHIDDSAKGFHEIDVPEENSAHVIASGRRGWLVIRTSDNMVIGNVAFGGDSTGLGDVSWDGLRHYGQKTDSPSGDTAYGYDAFSGATLGAFTFGDAGSFIHYTKAPVGCRVLLLVGDSSISQNAYVLDPFTMANLQTLGTPGFGYATESVNGDSVLAAQNRNATGGGQNSGLSLVRLAKDNGAGWRATETLELLSGFGYPGQIDTVPQLARYYVISRSTNEVFAVGDPVLPANTVPVANDDTYSVDEDNVLNVAAPGVLANDTDSENDSLSTSLVSGPSSGALMLNSDGSFSYTPGTNFNGTDALTYLVNDGELDSSVATVTITVNPVNDAPVLTADNATVSVDEGQNAANSGTFGDVDGDIVTLNASVGSVTNDGGGTWSWGLATSDGPSESQTVTITGDDSNGGMGTTTFDLTVNNVAPSVGSITAPMDPVEIGASVNVSAPLSDPGVLDVHTAVWDWGDGSQCDTSVDLDCFVTEAGGVGTTDATHAYSTPGVYTLNVTVTDNDGASDSSTYQFVVAYDPSNGFVTGGGWINSHLGAYVADPSLTGKANFGFVSKYKKGANVPTGQTEFQFKAGGLNFHSGSYDWLVVAGANAKFKGAGTINGGGNYGFMITATDANLTASATTDLFRIKIWDMDDGDAVVYDNRIGEPDDSEAGTAIGGGNISIK
ncbi:MAG: Ig-like domain-containing protein [Chloroflexi bacterium]|nr:Ig-like domain-containing protein [Chloroflexota bacterium]MDA1226570.1 Ig-like domain-containing protein [Chloroflexota bacterium]